MEGPGAAGGQFLRQDSILPQAQRQTAHGVCLIYPADFIIAGLLQRENPLSAQKLSRHGIQILRPGAHDDLLRPDREPPAPAQIGGQGLPELHAAGIGGFYEYAPPVVREDPAHRPGQERKGEVLHVRKLCAHVRELGPSGRERLAAARAEVCVIAAALAGLRISPVHQKLIGVRNGYDAYPQFPRQKAL